jgi:hypothetical protein
MGVPNFSNLLDTDPKRKTRQGLPSVRNGPARPRRRLLGPATGEASIESIQSSRRATIGSTAMARRAGR